MSACQHCGKEWQFGTCESTAARRALCEQTEYYAADKKHIQRQRLDAAALDREPTLKEQADHEAIAVTFLSDSTLNGALDGIGVDVEWIEPGLHDSGIWAEIRPSPNTGAEMFDLHDPITDKLVVRGFVGNVRRVTVL